MKIAHFSPLPPQRTGIAHYCAELLPYLTDYADIDVYTTAVNETAVSPSFFPTQSITNFVQALPAIRYQYDTCLYHMGNHPDYHEEIYTTMMRCPGIVVLHEVNLHAFYLQRKGSRAAYIREMGYAHGMSGINTAQQHLSGEKRLDINEYPMFQRIVHSSSGIIVHTDFARQAILSAIPSARVVTIPLAVRLPDATVLSKVAKKLPRPSPETILIGSFGYVADSKRIEIVLHALAALRGTVPDFHYFIIGTPLAGYELTLLINELELDDIVHQIGYADPDAFESYLSEVDIGINLRTAPSGGEMSATLVRLLAHGKPTAVSNIGGFAALPDTCVLKIEQDADEILHLTAALRPLIVDTDERARYGQAAQAHVRDNYSFPRIAQQYAAFVEKIAHA